MTTEKWKERRKYSRLESKMVVKYNGGGSKLTKSPCLNISLGGICFLAKGQLKKRAPLEMKIYLKTGEKRPLDIKGRVAWQGKTKRAKNGGVLTGVSFGRVKKTVQKRFADFVFDNLYNRVGIPDWVDNK